MDQTAMNGHGIGPRVISTRFMRQIMLVVAVTTALLTPHPAAALPGAEASLLPSTPQANLSAVFPSASASSFPSTADSEIFAREGSAPANYSCTCPPAAVPAPPPKPVPCSHNTVTSVSSTRPRSHSSHRRKAKRNNKPLPGNSTVSGINVSPDAPHVNCSTNSSSSECSNSTKYVAETSAKGDPHLIGRHGEKFEFHGQDGTSYCLVTDRKVQINMHLFAGAKKGSTYIDEIGVVTSSGIHIIVSAQSAADVSPQGVQGELEVNGASLPDDILTIDLHQRAVRIDRNKKSVRVRVRGVVDLTIDILPDFSRQSRPNYLNIRIRSLHASRKVHGIIGQTYPDSPSRLARFNESLTKQGPAIERAIIDGKEEDYRTSGVLDADCKFQQFGKKTPGGQHKK